MEACATVAEIFAGATMCPTLDCLIPSLIFRVNKGYDIAMDERDFYTERPESKSVEYPCPRCKRSNQYQVRWMRRTRKDRLPPRADERDRALYAKLRDYLIRVDDDVTCKTCQKRFEIPSHQTMVFLDERSPRTPSGNDDDDNRGNRA